MSDDQHPQPETEKPSISARVIGLFVDRPVMTAMATLAILVVGVLSLMRLPLQLTPDGFSGQTLNIYVPIRVPMPPREVEERVVEPLEELLRTIPGLGDIVSTASPGAARLTLELDGSLDKDLANAEVRDRLQRARLQWPSDVDRWFTWAQDASQLPLAFFQLGAPERDPEWDRKIDRIVKPRLEAVDGVGRADIFGLQDETIRIWFDRDKLVEHRLNYGTLLNALARDNVATPVGEYDDGKSRFLVRVDSRFESQDEIADYPIRTGLTIGDIARVEVVPSVRDSLSRYDGRFTYGGFLQLSAGKNPVDASRNLREACEDLENDPRLEGIKFRFLLDTGELIEQSLATLRTTSLQGAALALVALFVFLLNLRTTLAIAASIPLALLIAAGQMFFAGDSLNILTMAGLTLAVGLVVDNAVVVLDNIRRKRALGLDRRDACIDGTREMCLAITMATLTTIVVIAPLIFLSTDASLRAVFGGLGIPLSIALLGSLVVALLLMPAMIRRVGTAGSHDDPTRLAGPLKWLGAVTVGILDWGVRTPWRRALVCVALVMAFAIGMRPAFAGGLKFGSGDGNPFGGGDVSIYLQLPRGLTLRDSYDLVQEYEGWIEERKEELRIEHVSVRFDDRKVRFDLELDPEVQTDEFPETSRKIRESWPRKPGVAMTLADTGSSAMRGGGGGSEEQSDKNFVLRLWGPDTEYLQTVALSVCDRLRARPEVERVEVSGDTGDEEVIVRVDRERMNELGVQPQSLQNAMSAGLRGTELPRFQDGDRELRLIAQFDAQRNPTLVDLKETAIYTTTGTFQPVDALSNISFERALQSIDRRNGRTYVSIVGERAEDVDGIQMREVLGEVMEKTALPRGYSWSDSSRAQERLGQLTDLFNAGILSIVLIFLLMGVLFESVILPTAILATLPFAAAGAVQSLKYFNAASFDELTVIGVLLLFGIVVNNGIVLLDTITRLRREGMTRSEAMHEGVRVRLRPIVMTATTTIVGLLPMAIFGESTGSGLSYVSMSIAVAGGLAVCTVFTSLAVPLAYSILDDFANWLGGLFDRARAGRFEA